LDDGSIAVDQRAFAVELLSQAQPMLNKYGKNGGATPSDSHLFEEPVDSPLLNEDDKETYRSLNMSLMYAATRTYPECLPVATACASRFTRATEEDMRRLLKGIYYLERDLAHCLTVRPRSETVVCSADCSYAIHVDGYSHDGVAVGFVGGNGVPDAFFIFSSGKQTTIAKSSCHGELTTANVGADYIMWLRQVMEGFGSIGSPARMDRKGSGTEELYAAESPEPSVLRQDNQSTIHLIVKGRGSFRNSKHIRVRDYFIRDMVRDGEMVVHWQHTTLMVADVLSKGVTKKVFYSLLEALIGKRLNREE
jgi:hypothetical protein